MLAKLRKLRKTQLELEKTAGEKIDATAVRTRVYRVSLPVDGNLRAITDENAGSAKDAYEASREAVGDLVKLITATISPNGWNAEKGRWVRGIPGAIVVSQDAATQLEVKKMLKQIGALPSWHSASPTRGAGQGGGGIGGGGGAVGRGGGGGGIFRVRE